MAFTRLDITHTETDPTYMGLIGYLDATKDRQGFHALGRWFKAVAGGLKSGVSCIVSRAAVKATGTITLSSHVATDTCTVGGVVFTCMASGATGDQYNVGLSDTATAVNLAAALNASATAGAAGCFTATSNAAVVTVTASVAGRIGNSIQLAISAHGTVSGARLASGSDGTAVTLDLS